MARTRYIRHGFFRNEQLAECDPLARILFAGLWTIADKEGRLEDRPKRIKADVLPYDNCDVEKMLKELARRGFIVQYRIEGVPYISIPTWHSHQKVHNTEAPSTIPAPPDNVEVTDVQPIDNVDLTVKSTLNNASLTALNLNVNSNVNSNLNSNTNAPGASVGDAFQEWFDEAWATYPNNSDGKKPRKTQAIAAAQRITKRDRALVLTAIHNYNQSDKVQRGFVKEPAGFLNQDYWRDYIEPIKPTLVKGHVNGSGPINNRSAIVERATRARVEATARANEEPDYRPRLGPGADPI